MRRLGRATGAPREVSQPPRAAWPQLSGQPACSRGAGAQPGRRGEGVAGIRGGFEKLNLHPGKNWGVSAHAEVPQFLQLRNPPLLRLHSALLPGRRRLLPHRRRRLARRGAAAGVVQVSQGRFLFAHRHLWREGGRTAGALSRGGKGEKGSAEARGDEAAEAGLSGARTLGEGAQRASWAATCASRCLSASSAREAAARSSCRACLRSGGQAGRVTAQWARPPVRDYTRRWRRRA